MGLGGTEMTVYSYQVQGHQPEDTEEAYPADEARQPLGSQRADTSDHELSIKL